VPAQLDCLTRTIKLTGAVTNNTYLTQPVETNPIPVAALGVNTLVTAAIDAPTFGSMSSFWIAHHPHLLDAGVTILGFRNTYRAPITGDTGNAGSSTACNGDCTAS